MIRTVVLDLDGTLLDGRFRHYACYLKILKEHGYTPVDFESYWQMKMDRQEKRQRSSANPVETVYEELAAIGAEALYEEFLHAWLEYIEDPGLLALDRLQPGAIEKLREWRTRGVRLVLATMRRHPEHLNRQLSHLGLAELLDHVVVCECNLRGPGKARAVKDTVSDLQPEYCLWVGDTEFDVDAARTLGCPIWAITAGERREPFLSSLSPDYLSPDLASVSLERCHEASSV